MRVSQQGWWARHTPVFESQTPSSLGKSSLPPHLQNVQQHGHLAGSCRLGVGVTPAPVRAMSPPYPCPAILLNGKGTCQDDELLGPPRRPRPGLHNAEAGGALTCDRGRDACPDFEGPAEPGSVTDVGASVFPGR